MGDEATMTHEEVRVLRIIAGALDDGHGTPSEEIGAAEAVRLALLGEGFSIVRTDR